MALPAGRGRRRRAGGGILALDAGRSGRRAWNAAAIVGFAAGPALGGALTQALDWRAIFLVQAPIAAAAAVAAWRSRRPVIPPEEPAPWAVGPAVALALVSAALVGVLFLLVLLLITGWSVSPLAAAAAVSVLPIAAVVAARGPAAAAAGTGRGRRGARRRRRARRSARSRARRVVDDRAAADGGRRDGPGAARARRRAAARAHGADAARLLSARHIGITVALALLAPVAAARIDDTVAAGREQGTALVLDAKLPPLDKLELAEALVGDSIRSTRAGTLRSSLEKARGGIGADDGRRTRRSRAAPTGARRGRGAARRSRRRS